VLRFEQEFLDQVRRTSDVLGTIKETKQFGDDTKSALEELVTEFKKGFVTDEAAGGLHVGSEESEAMDEGDVGQEQIVRQKRG
jgi:F-type H+-transporting ATPase subunit alpha